MDETAAFELIRGYAEHHARAEPAQLRQAYLYVIAHGRGDSLRPYVPAILDQPFAQEVVVALAKENYRLVSGHIDWFKDKPYARDVALAMVHKNPIDMCMGEDFYLGTPYEADVAKTLARLQPGVFLSSFRSFKDKPYAKEVLLSLVNSGVLQFYPELYMDKPYAHEIVREIGKYYDMSYSRDLFMGTPFEREMVASIAEYNAAVVLGDPEFANKPYSAELRAHAAKSLATEKTALRTVQWFNDRHEQPPEQRFALLKFCSAADDFNLITLGREEAFSSSYQHILDDLMAKVKQSGKPLLAQLSPAQLGHMDVFLEIAATEKRLDDVLKQLPADKVSQVIHQLAVQAATSSDMRYTHTMAAMLLAEGCTPAIRHQLEQEVRQQYDQAKRAGNTRVEDRFGLLASTYVANAPPGVSFHGVPYKDDGVFFLGLAQNPRYRIAPLTGLDHASLVDRQGACNQRLVFAEDADAKASFSNWKAQYEGKPGWKIVENDHYTHIFSTGGHVPVHVYANHPGDEEQGLKGIDREVAARQKSAQPSYQVFVGRGHSYHAADYLARMQQEKLVYLGSCKGYENLSHVLNHSPGAQVISTQQTGTMKVNDPMLYSINQSINREGRIDWRAQEQVLSHLSADERYAYLLPDKNITLKMQQRYNELAHVPPNPLLEALPFLPPVPAAERTRQR